MADTSTGAAGGLAEPDLLARILPALPVADAAELGPGDDAAVLRAPDGRVVLTTDLMVEGPDFRLAWSSPEDLGWKAAATNLADVAAMGAMPTALLVGLALPPGADSGVADGIAGGLRLACEALAPGCGVVGGDLSTADALTIAVTAIGDLGGRAPVRRDGAGPGDVVALAGTAGLAAAGLALLFERAVGEDGAAAVPARDAFDADELALVGVQRRPVPPIAAGPAAANAGATAMLDVSDGLALDAERIAAASGCAIDLDAGALAAGAPSLAAALRGGEDHALLATFPAAAALPPGFRRIGSVVAGDGVLLDGEPVVGPLGWDPYLGWDGRRG